MSCGSPEDAVRVELNSHRWNTMGNFADLLQCNCHDVSLRWRLELEKQGMQFIRAYSMKIAIEQWDVCHIPLVGKRTSRMENKSSSTWIQRGFLTLSRLEIRTSQLRTKYDNSTPFFGLIRLLYMQKIAWGVRYCSSIRDNKYCWNLGNNYKRVCVMIIWRLLIIIK